MSTIISVQLDGVAALAAELAALALELGEDVRLCTSAAASLAAALSAEEGRRAVVAATGWSGLTRSLAERAGAVGATLDAAVASYRAADAALAERIGGRRGLSAVAR